MSAGWQNGNKGTKIRDVLLYRLTATIHQKRRFNIFLNSMFVQLVGRSTIFVPNDEKNYRHIPPGTDVHTAPSNQGDGEDIVQ